MSDPVRPWFWQLQAEGRGPDWLCLAAFAPGDAPALAAAVRRHAPAGFVREEPAGEPCAIHRLPHAHHSYVDPSTAEALARRRAGSTPGNRYIYHAIEVCGADLAVERGYGGYPGGPEGLAETALLLALAGDPGLTLVGWRVVAVGDGYTPVTVAEGTSAASLLAYLAPDVSPL